MEDTPVRWFSTHRAQLRLGLRITVAGLLSYVLCPLFGLVQTYPAVLTAVIVMQASIGASLKAMFERFVGSLGGALWGVMVLLALQHLSGLSHGVALVLTLAPLALLAAFKPEYRAAPTAAIILLLTPGSVAGPLAPAIQRMLGIGLGSAVALVVALSVFPTRARGTLTDRAGQAVVKMGELVAILMAGLFGRSDTAAIQNLHDDIRKTLSQTEAIADEVLRERATYLAAGPDPQPMCRSLRRLRNDLAMIGRATVDPLPESIRPFLAEPAAAIAASSAAFLLASGAAISRQAPSPSFADCERASAHFVASVKALRQAGLLRELPDETVGRVFSLAFGIEQLHQNLEDLVDRTNEWALQRA